MRVGVKDSIHSACTPREDVLKGELAEDQFAASLADVAHNPDSAPLVYTDPDQFFTNTYPTDGLSGLMDHLANRFTAHAKGSKHSGKNGLVELDTSFGGGKTHSQIGSYHLSNDPQSIPDLTEFIDNETATDYLAAVDDGLSVNTAVFVGAHVDATNARSDFNDPNAPDTNTMWGELAYQLFGQEGYEFLKEHDENRNPPGEGTLNRLFEGRDQPSLILLDEVAAYLEQATGVTVGGSNLGKQTNVFLLSLFKATQNTDAVTVVVSIADTAFGEQYDTVSTLIDDFNSIADRTECSFTPTEDDEVAPVLRKRLFDSVNMGIGGDVADAYERFYEANIESFPGDVTDHEYRDRLADSYPVHPTVIETLSEELDSLPSFQRTRGALKLISRAIFRLWEQQDDQEYPRHYIRLFDLHPSDPDVHSTLLQLFQSVDVDFDAAIKSDIYKDSGRANAEREDDRWLANGHPKLGTQITTTILWKSIVIGSEGRGITRQQLRAALAHPEVDISHYEGALNNLLGGNMDSACFFLFDEQRLQFKSEANLNKLIEREAEHAQDGVVRDTLSDMLSGIVGGGELSVIQGPEEPHEVPDDMDTVNLCVMDFDTVPIDDSGDDVPDIIQELNDWTARSSGGQRKKRGFKNHVVFLAPDAGVIPEARRAAARVSGIQYIQSHLGDQFDLNSQQVDELSEKLETASTDLSRAIKRAYRHLYYPAENGLNKTVIHSVESSEESHLHDVVLAALEDDEKVLLEDAGAHGGRWFKSTVWNESADSMTTHDIEEQFAKRPTAPILLSPVPLRETIANIVTEKGYAYWNADSHEGYYTADDDADAERSLEEAVNLTPGLDTSEVTLSDTQHLYEDLDDLLDDRGSVIEWQDTTTTGEGRSPPDSDDRGGHDMEGEDGGGDGVSLLPETVSAKTNHASHVPRAISELRAGIDTKVQAVADEHGYHHDDITATLSSLTITTTSESAWESTWFIANKVSGSDLFGGYANVDFEYNAVDNDADPEGQLGLEFNGTAEMFAAHFRSSMEPSALVTDDGDRAAEGTVTIDFGDADDPPDYGDALDALADALPGQDGFTVRLAAEVVAEAAAESEVSA